MTRSGADDLLRGLASTAVPLEDAEEAVRRRSRVTARLAEVRREEFARRDAKLLWRRRAMLVAAALLPIALFLSAERWIGTRADVAPADTARPVVLQALDGDVEVRRPDETTHRATGRSALSPFDRVLTAARSGASLSLPSGAVVTLEENTDARLAVPASELAERLDLSVGGVEIAVPPLAPGHSLAIETPHARVVVHGTRFSVRVRSESDGLLVTTVRVTEGVVSVVHAGADTRLAAGASWSSRVRETQTRTAIEPVIGKAPPSADETSADETRGARAGATTRGARPAPTMTPSTLADENRILQGAMTASRAGDDRRALALLDQLLGRYPQSPLAQNARVERFRALRRLGDTRAATRDARRYLAEHPDGFAQEEARRLALEPPAERH